MISRAETLIFWLSITMLPELIAATAIKWHLCKLLYPLPRRWSQLILFNVCADYFHYEGTNYLVIVDRYSNWPIVERAQDKGLIEVLRRIFVTYGIPDELSYNGSPKFVAHTTSSFLSDWGIHHRLSSVVFPHRNCRAEFGVKIIK